MFYQWLYEKLLYIFPFLEPKKEWGRNGLKIMIFFIFLFYEIKCIMISVLSADLRCMEDKTNKSDYLRIKNKRYILTR